jgi:hypothetical protein
MPTLFADIKTPYIDTLTTKRVLSPVVKDNIFQGIFTKPDEAVTEKYSEDTDASEIQVLRIKPTPNDARELGSDKNGKWFNDEEAATSSTEAYGIQILQTIDRNIDIPTNAQDMVSVDLLEGETRNLSGLVNRNINAMTIAAQLAKNFNNVAGVEKKNSNASALAIEPVTKNWVTIASNKYSDAIIDAAAYLDNGNEAEGIEAYPDDQRCVIIRPTAKAAMIKAISQLNGGAAVFDMLKRGGVDADNRPKIATTGYIGEFMNMPVYVASNVTFALVEKYLGLAAGALAKLGGIVVSAVGTGRALAFNSVIKQIPSPNGQGIRLQPKYRFGAECWDALSVVPMFMSEFTNPVTGVENALYVRGTGTRA